MADEVLRYVLLALADEMENDDTEKPRVRRYWAGRIRAAVEQTDEEPCAEFGSHLRGEHARLAREVGGDRG